MLLTLAQAAEGSLTITESLQRIVTHDRAALVITAILMVIQALVFRSVWRHTWAPLRRTRTGIKQFANTVREALKKPAPVSHSQSAQPNSQDSIEHASVPDDCAPTLPRPPSKKDLRGVERAWRLAVAARVTDQIDKQDGKANPPVAVAEPLEPEVAFAPARLLPPNYQSRLDTAAPGIFTALGIIGTFVGLIIGFLQVNPSAAEQSIGPLIGGMVVAFMNSLLGVVLSVVWSYRSRIHRHEFDVASDELAIAVEQLVQERFSDSGSTALLVAQFDRLQTALNNVAAATTESSAQLLKELSPQLQKSLQSLVSTPFENLNRTVEKFQTAVNDTAAQQKKISVDLALAAKSVSEAQSGLAKSLSGARECVAQFANITSNLSGANQNASAIVEQAKAAAEALDSVCREVREAATRYDSVSDALATTAAALQATDNSLSHHSTEFQNAASALESTVSAIQTTTHNEISESVGVVKGELERTVHELIQGLSGLSNSTISAYENSSNKVVSAVDGKMSDLTDRLAAELTTLGSRLPAQVEDLNRSMAIIRAQIQKASRSMDDAVNQLANQTPELLARQLREYDGALGTAMNHFSGTLAQWDDKITAITGMADSLEKIADNLDRLLPDDEPDGGLLPA